MGVPPASRVAARQRNGKGLPVFVRAASHGENICTRKTMSTHVRIRQTERNLICLTGSHRCTAHQQHVELMENRSLKICARQTRSRLPE
ncbi:hypothetical protein D3870_13435 [Noviherbaspirillum cavernae]|uniref:Uncharacterized protein n=2 Tax=Noviherbaspirillum cavernae TaxID=2320862 RepID=A0A418X334_9BURK|nr:hypothetical protein D3870_13435 [Noviherbaspirillum cavernae]